MPDVLETADKHLAEPTTNGNDHTHEYHPPIPTHAPPPVPTSSSAAPASTSSSSPTKGTNDQHHVETSTHNMPSIKSKSESSVPRADDDKEDRSEKRNRRKFAVNTRGFMGVTSMNTAKLVDEYQLLQVLGQGFYGKVYLATSVNSSTGEMVAVKQLDDRKFLPEQFDVISAEFNALHRIINRNIVAYKQIILDENLIYLVTEFVDNGSIYDLIQKNGPIPETQIGRFVKQIVAALTHLQDLKIVHRDLKCSNVLLTKSGECKITDFELSHKHESNRYTIRGAPYWMAPEVIEMTTTPTCACDIWALGCMIVEMLTGEPPYRKMGPMTALLSISRDNHPPLPETISAELKDFLIKCFAKDPAQRCSAKTLKAHPFLARENSEGNLQGNNRLTTLFPPNSTPSDSSHSSTTPASPAHPSSSSSASTHSPPRGSAPTTPTSASTPSHSNLAQARSSQHVSQFFNQNIVIDVYTEQDKEDLDLLEMTSEDQKETPASIEEKIQFKTPNFSKPAGASEIDALKAEIEYLRHLNEENVATGQKLKEKMKKTLEVQEQLTGLAWRLRNRTDTALENMRQAAKATAHANMLLKRTNQVATEALGHGAIVTSNIRKLEEYVLEGDPTGKKLMNIVFKKSVTPETLINPTISGSLLYTTHLKGWKKDKEKRAWFVLKDNFLFAFKNEKGVALESVYLGEGARLMPLSEEQCKRKFTFRVADMFLVATDTAELCSEWMLALSKPQKWYESSYEDNSVSPRAGRKGSEENVAPADSPPSAVVNTSPTHTPPTSSHPPSSHSHEKPEKSEKSDKNHKGSKGRSGSQPPANTQVFGVPIEELFARDGGNTPYFLMRMIQFLQEKGLHEEGILRISGSVSEINGLKESLNHGEDVDYSSHDPHAVAGLLKVFFRELPVPIIPEPFHSKILEVMINQVMLDDQRVVEVKMILDQLPAPNRALLRMLMNFLVQVNCNADKNKMTIQNLITCMVPTIKCVPGVFMYVIPNFDFVFDVE